MRTSQDATQRGASTNLLHDLLFGARGCHTSLSAGFALNCWRSPCNAFLRLQQSASVVVKIYTHIYPRWDIAFDHIFGYTDAVEVLFAPHMSVAISSGHV